MERSEAMSVRPAVAAEIDHLARLWHEGWHDAHGTLAPPRLVRARTLASFTARMAATLADTFVAGTSGFFMLKGDELYQFYVARAARGSGIAPALIADAEARLAARGVATAWLACGIGNDRAARFYEKCGWTRARTQVNRLETGSGHLGAIGVHRPRAESANNGGGDAVVRPSSGGRLGRTGARCVRHFYRIKSGNRRCDSRHRRRAQGPLVTCRERQTWRCACGLFLSQRRPSAVPADGVREGEARRFVAR